MMHCDALMHCFSTELTQRLSAQLTSKRVDSMAYSTKFREERRCRATRRDGQPCRAFARWNSADGLCSAHHFSHQVKGAGRCRGWLVTPDAITPLTENSRRVLDSGGLIAPWHNRYNSRRGVCACSGLTHKHRPGVVGCLYSDKPSTDGQNIK